MALIQRYRSRRELLAYTALVISVAAIVLLIPLYAPVTKSQQVAIVLPSVLSLYAGWGVWRIWGREKFPLRDETRTS